MNDEARAELDRILALSPADITEAEQGFLQARRSYLTEEQRITFGIVEPDAVSSGESAESAKPAQAGRKARQPKAE